MVISRNLLGWRVTAFFAILIGLYPIYYFLPDIPKGFLDSKVGLKDNTLWQLAFYMHIIGGGVALFIGWIQFWKKFRNKYIKTHRFIGLVYWISIILISGPASIYLAFFANGGVANKFGFGLLGVAWLFTTIKAITAIKNKDIISHQRWMIRSYALCFAAVTLRIYLPLFLAGFALPFEMAYAIIAWLCWLPNLGVSELIINYTKS